MDLSKLSIGTGPRSKATSPDEIFKSLTLRSTVENIHGPQAEALRLWDARRGQSDNVIGMVTGGGKTLVGLLISKSLVHETRRKVLDVCPKTGELLQRLIDLAPTGRVYAVAMGRTGLYIPAAAARPCRILLIEDNADAREMLSVTLRLDGHEVDAAEDGVTGLQLAETNAPDVALVDIGLPGLDGYEVARRLRASQPARSTVLVALTGYGQPEDKRRTEEAGFDAHLLKPVTAEALQSVLVGALSRGRLLVNFEWNRAIRRRASRPRAMPPWCSALPGTWPTHANSGPCQHREFSKNRLVPRLHRTMSAARPQRFFKRRVAMLWTIAVVLLVLWALGMVTSYTLGGVLHLLLVIALVVIVVQFISGRRAI